MRVERGLADEERDEEQLRVIGRLAGRRIPHDRRLLELLGLLNITCVAIGGAFARCYVMVQGISGTEIWDVWRVGRLRTGPEDDQTLAGGSADGLLRPRDRLRVLPLISALCCVARYSATFVDFSGGEAGSTRSRSDVFALS